MITLKNLNQPKSIPAVFDTEKEFIDYTIDEALWASLPTGEVPPWKNGDSLKLLMILLLMNMVVRKIFFTGLLI